METIEGLVYLLNQAGAALAEANQRIAALTKENEALRSSLTRSTESAKPVYTPEDNGAGALADL